ncbi:MAG: hypothetical protein MJZ81_07205 [Bacteroidales bacterium]|nr:hypothetical protein [Bacteroidales bacterium]
MAFQKEQVMDSIRTFIENPFWAEKYNNAPYGAKKRLALSFFFSQHKDDPDFQIDDYRNLREYIESSLSAEDLDYLVENDSNEAARKHFSELRQNLQSQPQPPSPQIMGQPVPQQPPQV